MITMCCLLVAALATRSPNLSMPALLIWSCAFISAVHAPVGRLFGNLKITWEKVSFGNLPTSSAGISGQPPQGSLCLFLHVHLDQANNPRRLVNVDDESDVSSFTTHAQLCSAEFLVEFEVTAFHSRFTD
jgi:hypothetical protein